MRYKRIILLTLSVCTLVLVASLLDRTGNAAPAALVVDTLDDEDDGVCTPGDCSLREAIAAAAPGETVTFAVNGTIVLSAALGDLDISQDLTIAGGGLVTVSGNNAVRVFNVTSGDVTFDGLTIADGFFTGTTNTCGLLTDKGGGGILNDGGNVTVMNSSLTGNSADCGGGILNDGTLTVSTSTFVGNSADCGSGCGSGGGIDNRSTATATVADSTLSNNTATQSGGGINNFGFLTLTKSTLSGNSTTTSGGGIYSQGTVTVTNSTFSDNLGSEGGGLHSYCGGNAVVNHSTFTANRVTTTDGGGGIVSTGDGCTSATTTVANSIVSGNVKDGTSTADDLALQSGTTSTFSSGGHNLIGTMGSGITFAGTGDQTNINDPKVGPLADNGGATLTHALLPGSFALDRGQCSSGPATDQRGVSRPQDSNCDIGAFEAQGNVQLVKQVETDSNAPGSAITYTLTFSNSGSDVATGVVVHDSVPVSVTVSGVTSSTFGSGVITITQTSGSPLPSVGGDFAWAVSDVATGAGGSLTLTGTISNSAGLLGTTITNSATITASNDITGTDNSSSVGVPIPQLSPVAGFSATPTSGTRPLEVSFSDASTGDISSRTWSFGDGGSSTEINPSHTYTTAGVYTVALTVSGPGGGDTETQTNYINVTAGSQTVWTNTDSLDAARGAHSATLLKNGQILVAGGRNDSGYLAGAELYDPATGQWSSTGSLKDARSFHSATLLLNGMVLATGGVGDGGKWLDSSELYDPSSGEWSTNPARNLKFARAFHSATLLVNGQVLVAGGRSANLNSLSSAELYDPATGKWSSTGSLIIAREGHGAALLSSGKVMVAGGAQDEPDRLSLDAVELYDPETGDWSFTDSLDIPRSQLSLTLLPNQKVLAAGGEIRMAGATEDASSITDLYDPATGQWSSIESMHWQRSGHQALLLPNGEVLAVSGLGIGGAILASSERYNWKNDTWKDAAALNKPRRNFTATPLRNGQVLVAGGSEDDFARRSPIDRAEIYDITLLETVTTTAKVLVPMLNVRSGPSTAHSIRGELGKDAIIELRGRNETASWVYVCCQAGVPEGWILGGPEFMQVVPLVQSASLGHTEVEVTPIAGLSVIAHYELSGPPYVEAPRGSSGTVGYSYQFGDFSFLTAYTPNSWRQTTEINIEYGYTNDEPTFSGCEVSSAVACLHTPAGPFTDFDFSVGFTTTGKSPRKFRDDDRVHAESVFKQSFEILPFGASSDFSSNRTDVSASKAKIFCLFCWDVTVRVAHWEDLDEHDKVEKCERDRRENLCYVEQALAAILDPCDREFDRSVTTISGAANADFSPDLLTYYDVRDVTLMQTGAGRRYIDLYYVHTGELAELIRGDAGIETEVLTMMEEVEPYLAALFNGDAGSMVISDQQVISVTHLIDTVASAAGPELRQLIDDELDRLPPPQEFVGKSVSDVRTMLENGGYDTPLIRSVGGNVSQLAGSGLVLQNNGGDDLPTNSNGAFTFSSLLEDGAAYAVTVKTQPTSPSQLCTVSNGSGTLSGADHTNVTVVCASGSTQNKSFLPFMAR